MHQPSNHRRRRPFAALGMAAVLCTVLSACETMEQKRHANLAEDSGTCAGFGAHHGSRDYTECMLTQQKRRDDKALNAAEQQRLTSQTAATNLEMVRRLECDREQKKDRKEGRHPRRCD